MQPIEEFTQYISPIQLRHYAVQYSAYLEGLDVTEEALKNPHTLITEYFASMEANPNEEEEETLVEFRAVLIREAEQIKDWLGALELLSQSSNNE